MADIIQLRRDTAANWTSENPTLAAGELAWESDTGKFKIGTGSTAWTGLSYSTVATGPQGPQGTAGADAPDSWVDYVLGTDFNTTSNAAQNVTGLSFTPSANTHYEFEGTLLLRTNTTTVGPRPGCSWPTGLTDGVVRFDTPSSATANAIVMGNFNAAVLAAVGGLPNTTQSWPCKVWGTLKAGASPSGDFQIQLASETNGTAVYVMAWSFLRTRVVA